MEWLCSTNTSYVSGHGVRLRGRTLENFLQNNHLHAAGTGADRIVGGRIRMFRLRGNIDLAELASRVAMTSEQLASVEAGDTRPTAGQLHAIARELGVGMQQLFTED